MADIKTKDAIKGTIKTFDKAAVASQRMKQVYISTKEKAETSTHANETSAEEYASDRIESETETVVYEGAHQFDKQGRKGVEATKENYQKAKSAANQFREKRAVKSLQKQSVSADSSNAIKTVPQTTKTIKESARSAGRKTIKTSAKSTAKIAGKSVKTAEKTSKATIKTSQQAAKAAQKTAQATVKTAQRAAQAAKTTAKAVATGVKVAVKATIAAVKAIIAATKALIAAIAAGGWIAVVVIIVICLIGLLLGSVFGIFFSGEDSGTGMSMQMVVQEINTEYDTELQAEKDAVSYNVLEMSGSSAVWKDVLAVYAVRTNTNSDNPQEVATMDDSKKQLLKDIFWEMNQISSRTESKTETQITETDDGHGNIVQTETTVTHTYLYITVSHKTVDEMANLYSFNQEQRDYLAELLKDENNSLWLAVLYGITVSDGQIIISKADYLPLGMFSWPLPDTYRVSSNFGYRADPFTGENKFHGGIDIAAPSGTPILAADNGVVEYANSTDSWGGGYGYHMKVSHGNGYETVYAHCSEICVTSGQSIAKGQIIGFVGTTGNSTGNHLHFEVRKNGERINPMNFFSND